MANRNTSAAAEEARSQTPEESAVKAQDIQEQIKEMQKIMQEQKSMIDKLNGEQGPGRERQRNTTGWA